MAQVQTTQVCTIIAEMCRRQRNECCHIKVGSYLYFLVYYVSGRKSGDTDFELVMPTQRFTVTHDNSKIFDIKLKMWHV